ncbi:MAG: DUF547 domain-containing protein [Rhodothermales bacterium]|nr:DUF547 domain-containing protein [Rhodothermales bacterium]MBO6780257.1 DUF547 domain-containing protein [Rhodothermales bacterium]
MRTALFTLVAILLVGFVALPEPYREVAKAVVTGPDEEALVQGVLEGGSVTAYETTYTRVLADVLTAEGLVHYDLLSKHPDWPTVVEGIEQFDFSTADTDARKLAFWLNAYNVHMMNLVLDRPGRDNVLGKDLGTVFFKRPVRVAGQMLTLDQIEHDLLREGEAAFEALRPSQFDPRIHVSLNCAAISCPRLWPEAYQADKLEAQLDKAMREYVNSPQHFRVEDGKLIASSLLKWFAEDFDRAGMPAGDWLLAHMSEDRPQYAELREHLRGRMAEEIDADFQYDWTVNRAG